MVHLPWGGGCSSGMQGEGHRDAAEDCSLLELEEIPPLASCWDSAA